MKLYLLSGPCGCGKTTLSNAFARHLVDEGGQNQVYVIHGDDFHAGFAETAKRVGPSCPGFLYWADILSFIWECILSTADKALRRGLDVIIDYVVEDELPLVMDLAQQHGAELCYGVLTAGESHIRQRLTQRGDPGLIDRALFLKQKLEMMPENQGRVIDTSGKTLEQLVVALKEMFDRK